MTRANLCVVFLPLLLLPCVSDALVSFKDSTVLSNSDINATGAINVNLKQPGVYLLYANSAGTAEFNQNATIIARTNDGTKTPIETTLDLLSAPDDAGLLTALSVKTGYSQVTIRLPDNETPVVFYVVKQAESAAPVYEAGTAKRTISCDGALHPLGMVTFLSAAPHFTVHGFDIRATDEKYVQVYTSGWDAVQNRNDELVESVLTVESKESALRSFTTIIGPIATVFVPLPGANTFSMRVAQDDWMTSDFLPGTSFSAVSPGFVSTINKQTYDTFYKEHISFHWTTNSEVDTTITTRYSDLDGTLYMLRVSNDGILKYPYTGPAKTDQNTGGTTEIFVFYVLPTIINEGVKPIFLVQIASAGEAQSTSSLSPKTIASSTSTHYPKTVASSTSTLSAQTIASSTSALPVNSSDGMVSSLPTVHSTQQSPPSTTTNFVNKRSVNILLLLFVASLIFH